MADSKFSVAKLFVSVTLSETVTKDKLKEKIKEDAKFKNKIFLCSDGSIICGHDTDEPVEYGFNESAEKRVSTLEKLLKDLGTDEGAVKAYIDAAKDEVIGKIEGLDLAEVGGVGSFIQSISQEDGKVVATASDLNAAAVAATAIEAADDTVAVAGTTVEAQVADLAKSIYTVDKAAAKYSLKRVDSNDKNVREAYQLIETIGDGEAHVVNGADTINVYKDSSLKEVKLVTEGKVTVDGVETTKTGQFLEFTYILEDGTESTVDLDVSTFLVESEFGEGLQVNNGIVSIKLDESKEVNKLQVTEAGISAAPLVTKLNDIFSKLCDSTAINYDPTGVHYNNDAPNSTYHEPYVYFTDKADQAAYFGTFIYRNKTLYTKDIASAYAVGLDEMGKHVATTGNYTSAATTIAGEIDALDAQVKVNADAIDVLNGTEDGSVSKAVADAKDALVDGASDDYNTLAKLEAKVKAGSTVVTAKEDGHVTVTVDTTAADGHAVVTVAEDDIASADALQEEIDRAKKIEGDLTEVITKMYDGQAKTAVEVKDINYNLVSIVQELENASNYWESYDDLSSSSTVNVEVDTDGDNLAPGNL